MRPSRRTLLTSLLALPALTLRAPGARAAAAELVMYDADWCGYCKAFHREARADYEAGPYGRALPLRILNVDRDRPWFRAAGPVRGTPTFVVVEDGAEVARFSGYGGREAFYQQLARALGQRERPPVPAPGSGVPRLVPISLTR